MKKVLLLMALMLPMVAQGVSIQTIKMGWKTKVISNVPTGGLGIMLERFDQTWPTSVGADVCQVMMTGADEMVLDKNTDYKVVNDSKNGYVEASGGGDHQYMSACVWRRSNGHRLFAVVIGQPVDPEIEIICFYDYDPQKKTLTPEPNAIGEWLDITARGDYSFMLPRVGKELLIFDSRDQLKHHFKWNGMRPVFDRTEQMADLNPAQFPGGLADDGRGPEETEPYGIPVTFDGDEYVRVFTAEQFLNALKSNAMILVAKNTEINLTPLLDDGSQFRTRYRQWRPEGSTEVGNQEVLISEQVFDGRQLTICNHKRMTIRGEGHSSIVVAPRYAFCLNFKDCEQIEIHNLTIGHTTGGHCQGGVIGVEGGWRISIHNCDLYGCGTYGLDLQNTRDFSMYSSNIHDCTYGIMMLNNVETAKFEKCDFFHNREFALVESHSSYPIFTGCRFYDNEPTAPLFSCDREFYLSGCAICHPTEKLGTMHVADQSGAKNWYDPNPHNASMKPRGIGPDQKQWEEGSSPYQQQVMDISEMPKGAERLDSHIQYAVYVNKESEEGASDAIFSVWLADERTGTVKKVCQTNPTAAPLWEQMKGKDPDAASTELQLIATAERAWIAPGDVSKVIVEGCPDGRNIWTYIIDTDAHTVKQLPSTEGVQDLNWSAKEIFVGSYAYDDDGRYSFRRVYNIDGKFLRRTGEIERE